MAIAPMIQVGDREGIQQLLLISSLTSRLTQLIFTIDKLGVNPWGHD